MEQHLVCVVNFKIDRSKQVAGVLGMVSLLVVIMGVRETIPLAVIFGSL